ncbi:hypothetical protein D5085_10255 [Ectothiorhodospiraceae bacterium BW-2]|nr:hypothetical protein D5085_10255 [Ectothiorhodospiraceae bacterium BW-2]
MTQLKSGQAQLRLQRLQLEYALQWHQQQQQLTQQLQQALAVQHQAEQGYREAASRRQRLQQLNQIQPLRHQRQKIARLQQQLVQTEEGQHGAELKLTEVDECRQIALDNQHHAAELLREHLQQWQALQPQFEQARALNSQINALQLPLQRRRNQLHELERELQLLKQSGPQPLYEAHELMGEESNYWQQELSFLQSQLEETQAQVNEMEHQLEALQLQRKSLLDGRPVPVVERQQQQQLCRFRESFEQADRELERVLLELERARTIVEQSRAELRYCRERLDEAEHHLQQALEEMELSWEQLEQCLLYGDDWLQEEAVALEQLYQQQLDARAVVKQCERLLRSHQMQSEGAMQLTVREIEQQLQRLTQSFPPV